MTRPLRVVQVTLHLDPLDRTPEELLDVRATLTETAVAVARTGVELFVIQTSRREHAIRRDGVVFEFLNESAVLPRPRFAPPRRPMRVIERALALAPDVVHLHGLERPFAIRAFAAGLNGVPIIAQDHGSHPPKGMRRLMQSWAFRRLAGCAFTTREQAQPFVDSGVLRRDVPLFEVLGGSTRFSPGDREEARRTAGVHGDPCLLWTGRLDANKDPMTVLAAFERALADLPDAHLWCCYGKAPLLADVQRRIEASPSLRRHTHLLGTQPHSAMESYFRAADFYLQASHREASGFSLMEAMACGTTPIVTDIPAARRIVGSAGALLPVGSVDAFAEALVAWASRDRCALRFETRAQFERSSTYEAIARELLVAYESVADAR